MLTQRNTSVSLSTPKFKKKFCYCADGNLNYNPVTCAEHLWWSRWNIKLYNIYIVPYGWLGNVNLTATYFCNVLYCSKSNGKWTSKRKKYNNNYYYLTSCVNSYVTNTSHTISKQQCSNTTAPTIRHLDLAILLLLLSSS